MISPYDFAKKQMDLTAEFAQYVVDHPEVDDVLPPESFIYFEMADEDEFNRYGRDFNLFAFGSRGWRHRKDPASLIPSSSRLGQLLDGSAWLGVTDVGLRMQPIAELSRKRLLITYPAKSNLSSPVSASVPSENAYTLG